MRCRRSTTSWWPRPSSRQDGTAIYADSTAGRPFGAVEAGRDFSCTMAFRSQLPTGSYQISIRIDRPDLRTTLVYHPPVSFFVTGRQTVAGVADLEAAFTRVDEDLCGVEATGLGREPAADVVL